MRTTTSPPAGGGRTITLPDIPYRRLTGFALVGIAGLLALFLIYLAAFTPLTASRNQQRLANTLKGAPLTVYKLVNGHLPPEGSAVAVIQIPSIGLDKVVVSGTSAADLMNGPGLMQGSSLPGTPGNAVLAGRRVTFGAPFGDIGSLRPGAKIHVVDGAGSFTYKVTKVRRSRYRPEGRGAADHRQPDHTGHVELQPGDQWTPGRPGRTRGPCHRGAEQHRRPFPVTTWD